MMQLTGKEAYTTVLLLLRFVVIWWFCNRSTCQNYKWIWFDRHWHTCKSSNSTWIMEATHLSNQANPDSQEFIKVFIHCTALLSRTNNQYELLELINTLSWQQKIDNVLPLSLLASASASASVYLYWLCQLSVSNEQRCHVVLNLRGNDRIVL